MVLNTILPPEQWFFNFLRLLHLKYFNVPVYKLGLPFLEIKYFKQLLCIVFF